MKNIITIGGSNSKNSINKLFAEYTGSLLNNVELSKIDLNDFNLPLFSVDVENKHGFSDDLKKMNSIIDEADGFVISLAEHNGAYSVAFKNAFDWLSRIEGEVWRNKPMLLLATSPGARGGETALNIALGRFPYMGGNIIGSMSFPSFFENFKEGEITNPKFKATHLKLVNKFQNAI